MPAADKGLCYVKLICLVRKAPSSLHAAGPERAAHTARSADECAVSTASSEEVGPGMYIQVDGLGW